MTTVALAGGPARMRVAFYGRTAHAQTVDQTNGDLAGQYLTCVQALPTNALVTTVFYDLGPTNWLQPHPPEYLTINDSWLRRDGGLSHLLAEAQQTHTRRFDYLIAVGPDRLCRHSQHWLALLQQLHDIGVGALFADQPDTAATPNRDRLVRLALQAYLDDTRTIACRLREDQVR